MDMKNIASAFDTSVTVRFPGETHEKLKELALENGRSFNSEIIKRLNESIHGQVPRKKAG